MEAPKIICCGPRSWRDPAPICEALGRVAQAMPDAVIVHGAANGADSIFATAAAQLGLPVLAFPALWDAFGRSAGFRRNALMLAQPGVIGVLACVPASGLTRGTGHMVRIARAAGVPVWRVAPSQLPLFSPEAVKAPSPRPA